MMSGRLSLVALFVVATACKTQREAAGTPAADDSSFLATTVLRVGEAVPTYQATGLAGGSISLGGQTDSITLVNVWATWCTACREEHPNLLAFARARRLPIYGLDYKDERRSGQRWLANFGDPYDASLFDPDGRAGLDWGVYGVPETFIVDRDGIVRFKHIGAITPEVIRDRIEPLLRQLHG